MDTPKHEMRAPAPEMLKRVRHDLSTSISFIEAAMENLTSKQADIPRASRIYSHGMDKLRKLLAQLDLTVQDDDS